MAELAKAFGFPLVVVSRNVLGTINQTLQTLIAATVYCREKGTGPLRNGRASHQWTALCGLIAGVVLNNPAAPSADDASLSQNRRELAAHCVPPILAEVAWGARDFDAAVDWFALAR